MKKHVGIIPVVVALTALLFPAGAATAKASLLVKIDRNATLVEGGQAVEVTLKVKCPAGSEVLEAFAYVVQDGNQSEFGFIPVTCDGAMHKYVARARGLDVTFHRGEARVSAYVLLESGESTSPGRTVRIR